MCDGLRRGDISPDDVEDNNDEVGMEEQEEVDNGDIVEEGLSVAVVSLSCSIFDSLFHVVSNCLIGRSCGACSSGSSHGHSHPPIEGAGNVMEVTTTSQVLHKS